MSDEPLPLAGLVVLDISSFIAAPAAAAALADYGADVIKIEPPGDGDPHRNSFRNASYPPSEHNFPWQLDGRLKRSLALDLKTDGARTILNRLLKRADVMIVNFPPPARERLRLRWEDIEPLNPRLVYCSLTGYGETGPDRDRPGFDVTAYFGRSGILDAARYEGGPPGLSLPAQGDRATAMTLVAAILMGLRRRDQTGKGGWVGTSLYANGVWANGTSAAGALVGAKLPPRQSPDKPRNALTNLYRTQDDRWLQLLMVRDDRLWEKFCAVIDRPELLVDERFT
ncbi:CaiB/BaiF CoA-transferase family protein, partial [Reyranella sp.]|uniref:CaiB/BaiF CoA transferase family protein n=1 Tax=Reyranella sp. TaxID=1929291 RepID=UPI00273047F6